MSKLCDYCGMKLPEGEKYCPDCGRSADGSGAFNAPPAEEPEKKQKLTAINGSEYAYGESPYGKGEGDREINKLMMTLAIITTLIFNQLLGGLAIASVYMASKAKTDEEERSRLKAAGLLMAVGSAIMIALYLPIFIL